MSNKIVGAIAFSTGVAVGVLGSWRILKKYYTDMANEEIQSVKDMYKAENNDTVVVTTCNAELVRGFKDGVKTSDISVIDGAVNTVKEKCEEIIERCNYRTYSDDPKRDVQEGVDFYMERDKPYTIPPEDFSMFEDYDTIFCDYFADGILADDTGKIIMDVDDLVGKENLQKFGEYEDDTIYVRNDQRKIDFEICKDLSAYEPSDESEYSYPEKDVE